MVFEANVTEGLTGEAHGDVHVVKCMIRQPYKVFITADTKSQVFRPGMPLALQVCVCVCA